MGVDDHSDRSLILASNLGITKRSEALVARGIRDFENSVEAPAEYKLATKLEFGAAPNLAAAAEHYKKAADFGHVASQFLLSDLYETGCGVDHNQAEATRWFSRVREAAKSEHSRPEDAKFGYAEHLAHFCHSGHAIGRTDEVAWLEYLAFQRKDESRGDALYHLGLECGGGLGRWPRDIRALPSQKLLKAYMWFRLSAEAYERAIEAAAVSATQRYSLNLAFASSRWMCRLVMPKMEISEIAEAETLATERERGTQLGKRILVVDDEEPIRVIVGSILESAGFRCLLAESGNHALALLDSGENVDLITSCLLMADLDGLSLLEQVKRKYPYIPFAVLSAINDLSVFEALFRIGASDYLLKPFDVHQLMATVQRALRTA